MKFDFSSINQSHIRVGSAFLLFGNFKHSFEVFCAFVHRSVLSQFGRDNQINIHCCSMNDCYQFLKNRCDLFGNCIEIFCVRNVEDARLEKLQQVLLSENCIFIFEAGEFQKSKNVTDYFSKNRGMYAIFSFKNDITLISLCKLLLPESIPTEIHHEIVNLLKNTDEPLVSFFEKINLLLSNAGVDIKKNKDILREYITYKASFLQNLEFIPLARYFQKLAIKEKFLDKKRTSTDIPGLSQRMAIEKKLKLEIIQKTKMQLPKSVLFWADDQNNQ